jgi:hypothetical protein
MGEPIGEEQRYQREQNLARARHDAIKVVTDEFFGYITLETASTSGTGELERTINPKDVVEMLDTTLNALQGKGLVRDSLGITPPDIGNFVDHAISFFEATEFIDRKEQ